MYIDRRETSKDILIREGGGVGDGRRRSRVVHVGL